VEALTVRLLPAATASGAENMAADEVLLHTALAGTPSLRLYRWSEATLSLGYFQPHRVRAQHRGLEQLPWVRRPTGGLTLVHHLELTYAFTLPPGAVGTTLSDWLQRFHAVIGQALEHFGAGPTVADRDAPPSADSLCFHHITRGDLVLDTHKVSGSAQRRHRGALLQHGAILLAQSPWTPSLPGLAQFGATLDTEELSRELLACIMRSLHWNLVAGQWTDQERERTAHLIRHKYAAADWNEKR
jgi:lipoate-protein ligase A